uniref:Ero1-like protein n=1 Tax=Lygus hesperus TaxID=30085 RepID=A0A0A9X5V9_LYGHE
MTKYLVIWMIFITSPVISGTYHATIKSIISQHDRSDNEGSDCLCLLKGQIEDCACSVDVVDQFNNVKLYPRLRSVLGKDYFRFYKVNFQRRCPFWEEDGKCSMKTCHVKLCHEEDIPPGLRENLTVEDEVLISKSHECEKESDTDTELGHLNMTISPDVFKGFELWQAYDEDNFSVYPDEDGEAQYVDLLLNPERYTGYKGKAAHRIWKAIYLENCFWSQAPLDLNNLCLEKRVFYRVISGLHASINIHLSANYLFGRRSRAFLTQQVNDEWGRNAAEFNRRFSPSYTNGLGPQWLKNLYFLYLVELRAVAKVAPYLQNESFYTGNIDDDRETKIAISDIVRIVDSFKHHFNESALFDGGGQTADDLKKEFRYRFRNVSRIMDCVGCQKCKLWGKLQVQGLGTALKILFSGRFDPISTEIQNEQSNSTSNDPKTT